MLLNKLSFVRPSLHANYYGTNTHRHLTTNNDGRRLPFDQRPSHCTSAGPRISVLVQYRWLASKWDHNIQDLYDNRRSPFSMTIFVTFTRWMWILIVCNANEYPWVLNNRPPSRLLSFQIFPNTNRFYSNSPRLLSFQIFTNPIAY